MSSPTKHKGKGYWSFWGEDIVVFEMCADYRIGRLRMLPDFSQVRVAKQCVYG